ncbi:MAG: M23 family metallopeptidase [Oscillospiraceae bacterium]|nr:M23 family metallopeptidase [Oscillospiraceae bacterium]
MKGKRKENWTVWPPFDRLWLPFWDKRVLAAGLCCLLLFTGCRAQEQRTDMSEPESLIVSQMVPAAPKGLEIAVGEETVTLYPGEENYRTVTLLEALPRSEAAATVQILLEDQQVFSGSTSNLEDFLPAKNGSYDYLFTDGENAYALTVETAFAPQISWPEGAVELGEVLPIAVRYTDAETVSAETTLSFQPSFYKWEGAWEGLLPIHWNTQPGIYPLTVRAGTAVFELAITVSDRAFEIQNLTVDETTTSQTVDNNEANAEWNTKIEPMKEISDPVQYWSGEFIQPVEGELTTQYGMIRYVNGNPTSVRHSGVDLAADEGTPVQAAGAGRVLFADYLQLTGNTVLIEHGLGLKSWYYHMESLNVAQGDMVEQGQVIGKVGSTGFSTGPHLHFAMSVNRVFVNPGTAIEKGIVWEGAGE